MFLRSIYRSKEYKYGTILTVNKHLYLQQINTKAEGCNIPKNAFGRLIVTDNWHFLDNAQWYSSEEITVKIIRWDGFRRKKQATTQEVCKSYLKMAALYTKTHRSIVQRTDQDWNSVEVLQTYGCGGYYHMAVNLNQWKLKIRHHTGSEYETLRFVNGRTKIE